jgi:hypothetical protein
MNAWTRFTFATTLILGFISATAHSQEDSASIEAKSQSTDHSQHWSVPVPCELPSKLRGRFKPFASVLCVDFTGDGRGDFIALKKSSPEHSSEQNSDLVGVEWWITSNGQVIRREKIFSSDYAYRWFQKLGNDTVPAIISAWGFSDGIDYTVQKLDLKTGKLKHLFYFEPVLVEADGRQFHGYPWDLTRLQTLARNGEILLRASVRLRNGLYDETNDNENNLQQCVPMLYFDGTSSQRDSTASEQSGNGQWVSLDAIAKQTKARTTHRTTAFGACNLGE